MAITVSVITAPNPGVVAQAASLHRRSLPSSFLASLGEPFLRALYDAVLRQGAAFLVVARDGGRLQGYILASADSKRLLSVVTRSPLRFAWSLVLATLRDPWTVARIVETLAYGGRSDPGIAAELIVIAVEANVRSQGIGRRLLGVLDDELRTRGVRTYKVTVYRDLTDANRFYIQNGFRQHSTFALYGRDWNMYVRDIVHAASG